MMSEKTTISYGKQAVLALMLLILLAVGTWFYSVQKQTMRQAVDMNLATIAKFKVNEIAAWRNERLEDGAALMNRPFLIQRIAQSLLESQAGRLEGILDDLRTLQQGHAYADILLVNPQGRLIVSLAGQRKVHCEYTSALATALRDRKPVFTGLHKDTQYPGTHISVIAPLFNAVGSTPGPVGAVILVSDASRFLYPLLKSWPTPSKTAETVLVRRDGDDVLFLNDLRHQPETALNLRIPLNRTYLTAVMAVQGKQGIVQGRDYRGVKVISVILAVPHSPWYLVAKIDAAEAMAEWRFRAILILTLLLSLVGITWVFALVVWQREQVNHYQSLYRTEAALLAGAKRHSVTLQAIGDGVIVTDAQGRVELLNPVAETLTGWSTEAAQGRPLEEVFCIVDEETQARVESPVSRVLRNGVVAGLANHTLLLAKTGAAIPIADSGAPILNPQGQITGVVLVFRDQSAERDHQKKLSESERKYRSLYNSIRDAILVADTNRIIIDCNPAFVDLFGYSPEDIIGKKTITIYENEIGYTAIGNALRTKGSEFSEFLYTGNFRKKSGEVFPGETKVFYLRDDKGTLIGAIGLIRDVTKRQQVEAERNRMMAAIEQINEMIVITDTEGAIQYVNPAFERVTGYSRKEVLGLNPRILKSGEQDQNFYRKLWATIADGKTWEGRIVNKRKDGTLFTEDTTISPVCDAAGQIVNYVAAKRDITKHLGLAAQFQQAQKMESIGRLAGGVAHDYNNMLNVIIGYAELGMKKVDSAEPLYANLKAILNAALRSADITRQLLAFARRQTITPLVLDLNETVAGTLDMLHRLIGEDINLSWRPGAHLWPVKIDPTQVDQILTNLCVNARDAITGVGKITIETENATFDKAYCAHHAGFSPGAYVLLAVSDNGCGMDKKTLENIFEPFFTTKGIGRGTGLGLSTVYGIVKQNNGFINVYSEPGKGTTIKVFLARHAGHKVESNEASTVQMLPGRGETILVVEDETSILELTRTTLDDLGYHILAAGSPEEAFRLAEEHDGPIDLLITDVVMPGMNGKELAVRLRSVYPELEQLFMSGYTANVIVDHGVLDHGVQFLQKPFSISTLAAKVRAVLDRKESSGRPVTKPYEKS